jgi:hypothetical protein
MAACLQTVDLLLGETFCCNTGCGLATEVLSWHQLCYCTRRRDTSDCAAAVVLELMAYDNVVSPAAEAALVDTQVLTHAVQWLSRVQEDQAA